MAKSFDIKIVDGRGRHLVIGTLIKESDQMVFYKKVKRSKHFMKISQAYGIQKEVFDKWLRGKDISIVIDETDTKVVFNSHVKDWEEHASHQNYGHGRQMFLSTKYMEKVSTKEEDESL